MYKSLGLIHSTGCKVKFSIDIYQNIFNGNAIVIKGLQTSLDNHIKEG